MSLPIEIGNAFSAMFKRAESPWTRPTEHLQRTGAFQYSWLTSIWGLRSIYVNNSIARITVRDPFPGNTLGWFPEWSEANGSGIWVSPGSDGSDIVGNTFEDIAFFGVVVEGDSNRVELRSESDTVRDLGRRNRLTQQAEGQ